MKKLLSLTTILACASCLGAYADADAVIAAAKDPGSAGVLSFGGFYGVALKDIADDTDKIGISGVFVNYEFPALITEGKFSVSPFIESMLGAGYSDDIDIYYIYDPRIRSSADTYVVHWTLAVGANCRYQLNEKFALTANAKIGLDVEYVDIDPDHYFDEEDDTAAGFLWGVGVGGEYQISKRWGITVGVDYLASTARPDLDGYGKMDQQSYIVISAGATFRF